MSINSASYNYHALTEQALRSVQDGFSRGPGPGHQAPSIPIYDLLYDETVDLASLWRESPCILEFGSATTLQSGLNAADMEDLSRSKSRWRFRFVYTRETHPSEKYPAHTSLEQKIAHAKDIAKRWNFSWRSILVDDLSGSLHRLYGLLPSMVYGISTSGVVLFRMSTTDAPTLASLIKKIEQRGNYEFNRSSPRIDHVIHSEVLAPLDCSETLETLWANGPASAYEFVNTYEQLHGPSDTVTAMRTWINAQQSQTIPE